MSRSRETASSLALVPKLPNAHLDGKHGSILSEMTTIIGHDFPSPETLPDALQKRRCQIRTIVERGHPDQFVAAIAQAFARLAIHIENGRILIVEKERIGCVVHHGAEARLARAQLALGLFQLRDVLQNAKLAQRSPRAVPGDIALAVDDSQGPIGTQHPIFHVVAWTPRAYGGRSGIGYFRSVLGVNQFQPCAQQAAFPRSGQPRPKQLRHR